MIPFRLWLKDSKSEGSSENHGGGVNQHGTDHGEVGSEMAARNCAPRKPNEWFQQDGTSSLIRDDAGADIGAV